MALIVEDGTGKLDAESYCSVVDANKYFKDRGIAAWDDLGTTDKEIALRNATDYIELRFANRFKGVRATDTQALSFPRMWEHVVPKQLVRACAEYALRAHTAPLVADPVVDARGLAVKSVSEKLGPLEETTEYATQARDLFKAYPAADNLLQSLLRPARLIR